MMMFPALLTTAAILRLTPTACIATSGVHRPCAVRLGRPYRHPRPAVRQHVAMGICMMADDDQADQSAEDDTTVAEVS